MHDLKFIIIASINIYVIMVQWARTYGNVGNEHVPLTLDYHLSYDINTSYIVFTTVHIISALPFTEMSP